MVNKEGLKERRDRILHWLFQIGIWIKGFDGVLELVGGILLLMVSPHALNHYVMMMTQGEINEDPDDLAANALRHMARNLSVSSKHIGAAYLLGNGVVKILLAIGILRGKLWCYPTAIVVIALFVCLEIARISMHFSFLMLTGMLIDTLIIMLIAREYRHIKSQHT